MKGYLHDYFYNTLEQKVNSEDAKYSEQIKRIVALGPDSGFMELCRKFAEIGTKAPKFRKEGTCDVSASFQYADMDAAKVATLEYIEKHGICDINELLHLIKEMHSHSVEHDGTVSGVVQPKNYDFSSPFYGKYYVFSELPDDVFEDVCKRITAGTHD